MKQARNHDRLIIEPISSNNVNALTALCTCMFPGTVYEEEFDAFTAVMESANETCFLAKVGDEYAGFIQLALRNQYVEGSEVCPTAYVEAIFVKEQYRRSGIAARLIEQATIWALENNSTVLASDTEITNLQGISFHNHMGFTEVNRIVCFVKKLVP